jgi:hypothetical protein
LRAFEREEQKEQRGHQCAATRYHNHGAAVDPIGKESGGNRERELGQKCDQANECEIEGLMTDRVDLPGNGRVGDCLTEPCALTRNEVREKAALF